MYNMLRQNRVKDDKKEGFWLPTYLLLWLYTKLYHLQDR